MKKLASILIVMLASFALLATGSSESSSDGRVTITIGEHVANIETQSPHVAKIISGFLAENPDVDIQVSGSEVSEHLTKMRLAAQNDSLPDIIWLEQPIAKEMAAAGYHIRHLNDGKAEPQFIYSRLPILSARRISYESSTNGSVAVELLYDGDTVLVVNNHLESYKLTPEDKQVYKDIIHDPENIRSERSSRDLVRKMADASRVRGPQIDSVLNYIRHSGREGVVVCGDFNDSPISYSCRRCSSALTSAFRQSGNGLGLSYNQKGFYFRIDHIFVSDYWQTYETHVDKTALWSDHYPMITYLKKHKK